MKRFIHSREGASKGAALMIVLALVVLAPALGLAYFSRSTTDRHLADPSLNDTTARDISIEVHHGQGTIYNPERTMATSACLFISNAVIVSPGNFYKVGDNLDPAYGTLCSPADNYGFRLRVASVDSSGHVTSVTIIPGIGYSVPPSNPIGFLGSASGTGFTANCTFQ